ncbi:MAG: DUF2889 domain-containing protein [Cytophagales bacterium]|nr:DUF2889 domain-containing protein [Cytophagales bacterium]
MTTENNTPPPATLELPPAPPRRHLHDRTITYRGYLREDGLWDIEGELRDSKPEPIKLGYRGDLPANEAVHHMLIRVTIDDAMVIHDIAAAMPSTPYLECRPAIDSIRAVIGLQMGRGWKRKIEDAIGGLQGCTHVRELLSGAATAAYQTVYPYRSNNSKVRSDQITQQPKHLNQCTAWDLKGAVVMRYFPQFAVRAEA